MPGKLARDLQRNGRLRGRRGNGGAVSVTAPPFRHDRPERSATCPARLAAKG
jgi:hypothetical protein